MKDPSLQAVLLLDADDHGELEPLTLDTHRTLLPLVNVPLIDYTLEWLFGSSIIREIFILGTRKSIRIVEAYLSSQESRWQAYFLMPGQRTPDFMSPSQHKQLPNVLPMPRIRFMPVIGKGVGDALRVLDSYGCISGDFLLLRGTNVVSTMDIGKWWKAHLSNKQEHKNVAMTLLYKRLPHDHIRRPRSSNIVLVTDEAHRILKYQDIDMVRLIQQKLESGRIGCPDLRVNRKIIDENPRIEILSDFVGTGVDICSVDVLALFSENFDYQDLYRDFLCGILGSEILSHRFFIHKLDEHEYLANVTTPFLYNAVSRDILQRWTFSVVPGSHLFSSNIGFTSTHYNQYVSSINVKLSKTSKLINEVFIAPDVTVRENTVIENSVLGRNCIIGSNVRLKGSYLFENVVVGDNCTIGGSILGVSCRIGNNVVLKRGSVIGNNVSIGPDLTLKCIRIASADVLKKHGYDPGAGSNGVEWSIGMSRKWSREYETEEEDESGSESSSTQEDQMEIWRGLNSMETRMYEQELNAVQTYVEDSDGSRSEEGYEHVGGEEHTEDRERRRISVQTEGFVHEATETLHHVLNADDSNDTLVENVCLEINALKFSCNVDISTLQHTVYSVVVDWILGLDAAAPETIQAHIEKWSPLLLKFLEDESDVLDMVSATCLDSDIEMRVVLDRFPWLVVAMYQNDILSESAILHWWEETPASPEEESLKKSLAEFVAWLGAAEEE